MMTPTIEEQIWNYADGLLSEHEKVNIEKLLQENETYRQYMAEVTEIRKSFGVLKLPSLSASFSNKIMTQYKKHYQQQESHRPAVNRITILLVTIVLLASPCFMLAMVVFQINFKVVSLLDAVEGNVLIAALVLLNLIFGARYFWLRSELKRRYGL